MLSLFKENYSFSVGRDRSHGLRGRREPHPEHHLEEERQDDGSRLLLILLLFFSRRRGEKEEGKERYNKDAARSKRDAQTANMANFCKCALNYPPILLSWSYHLPFPFFFFVFTCGDSRQVKQWSHLLLFFLGGMYFLSP